VAAVPPEELDSPLKRLLGPFGIALHGAARRRAAPAAAWAGLGRRAAAACCAAVLAGACWDLLMGQGPSGARFTWAAIS
jgi:hypothetical protein